MEQTQIYEFLGVDHDPLFYKIAQLKVGQVIEIENIKIYLNQQGLYELETDTTHECYKTQNQLYNGISKVFSLIFE